MPDFKPEAERVAAAEDEAQGSTVGETEERERDDGRGDDAREGPAAAARRAS